jgi:hypothetical protein
MKLLTATTADIGNDSSISFWMPSHLIATEPQFISFSLLYQIYIPYLIHYNIVFLNNGLRTLTEVIFKSIHYSMKKLNNKQWRNCKVKFRELNIN